MSQQSRTATTRAHVSTRPVVAYGWWIAGPCWRVFDGRRLLAICGSEARAAAFVAGAQP